MTPFSLRLMYYAGAPAYQRRPFGHQYGPGFVWTKHQEIVKRRIHLSRKWVYDNSEITAYGVNMRLLMQRQKRKN